MLCYVYQELRIARLVYGARTLVSCIPTALSQQHGLVRDLYVHTSSLFTLSHPHTLTDTLPHTFTHSQTHSPTHSPLQSHTNSPHVHSGFHVCIYLLLTLSPLHQSHTHPSSHITTCVYTHTRTRAHTRTHSHTHTYTRTHAHTRTHTHTHTHTAGVPYDGVSVDEVVNGVHESITSIMIIFSLAGIVFSVACLIFNFYFRNQTYVQH